MIEIPHFLPCYLFAGGKLEPNITLQCCSPCLYHSHCWVMLILYYGLWFTLQSSHQRNAGCLCLPQEWRMEALQRLRLPLRLALVVNRVLAETSTLVMGHPLLHTGLMRPDVHMCQFPHLLLYMRRHWGWPLRLQNFPHNVLKNCRASIFAVEQRIGH